MNVADIINLMGSLSLESDNVSDGEKAIFLQYLNLVHLDLYAATANFNSDILVRENLANQQDSNEITLSETPFIINKVYIPGTFTKLNPKSLFTLIEEDPDLSKTGEPTDYWAKKNVINFYPAQTKIINTVIWYAPMSQPFTLNTQEDEIPYPVQYHNILADGALYYVFQDASGFKNPLKEEEAKMRWQKGKSRLLSYFYDGLDIPVDTYSNV